MGCRGRTAGMPQCQCYLVAQLQLEEAHLPTGVMMKSEGMELACEQGIQFSVFHDGTKGCLVHHCHQRSMKINDLKAPVCALLLFDGYTIR